MANQLVAIIPGDGIGPEIMGAVTRILDEAECGLEYDYLQAGAIAIAQGRQAMPEETIERIREIKIALKGPTTTPIGIGHKSANVILRQALDLYANVRPVKSLPGIGGHFADIRIDLIIVRENTEDLYAGVEYQAHPDVAQAIKVITRPGSNRLARYAFEMTRQQGRKRVTAVHKANIMKLTDGMFLEEFYRVAKDYPELTADDIIVDNCCLQMVTRPEQFDVMVTENLYGDIVSDLGAGLVGGLGVAPGSNIGKEIAVFEAVHGSAPAIAGKGIANPTALLFSGLMLLRHLGLNDKANKIGRAVFKVLAAGEVRTSDLGGTASTYEYVEAILKQLKNPS
ncbi:MAG: NAD-dependent isocitrate dehydrogenase [Armatimonadota bacterium]